MPSSSSNSGRLVKVAYALNQMEAEMIQGLLGEHGIPSMVQRTVDNPEFLAAGPRQILVPEEAAAEAREVLEGTPGSD
ncbi:MAG: putative signal transducing protein [Solirubrobacterales bacterium]